MKLDYVEVGSRIAKRRKELGLKQYELCEMIDVNYKYISNLETGRSAPSLETVMSLCKALKISPDYLLVGAEPVDRVITDEQIMDKIKQLNSSAKIALNEIIDMILNNG